MSTTLETLPNDVTELKKIVQELVSQQAALQAALQAEKEKYAALQRLVFGQKSEKKPEWENPKQEMLFNEA